MNTGVNLLSRSTQLAQGRLSHIVFYVCIKCFFCVPNVCNYSSPCPKCFVLSCLILCSQMPFWPLPFFKSNFSILSCLVQRSYHPWILSSSPHFEMTFPVTELLQNYLLVLWYFVYVDVWESKHLCAIWPHPLILCLYHHTGQNLYHLSPGWLHSLLVGLCTVKHPTSSLIHSLHRNRIFFLIPMWLCQSFAWNQSVTLH